MALTVVAALVAGVTGAVVTSYFAKATPENARVPVPQPSAQPDRPTVVPPGWNRQLLGRMGALEQELAELKLREPAKTEAEPAKTDGEPALEVSDRETERQVQYQNELDYREERLAALAAEPLDVSWSRTQSAQLRDTLAPIAGPAAIKSIDCRSKGCAAVITFPSPGEALAATGVRGFPRFFVEGCGGVAITPTPPESAGPYDLTILYACR
jgi:hypothetical protein